MSKVFRIYDDDDTGLITKANLLRCAKEDLDEGLTPEEASEMIRMGDRDRKGAIDHLDFM